MRRAKRAAPPHPPSAGAIAERGRRLEAVRAVTGEITRELDLTVLLELIIRRATELVGATAGGIYLWDDAGQVLVPRAWLGVGDWIADVRLRLGEGVTGTAGERRAGMVVNDYRTSPIASPSFLERTEIVAVLAEPLLYRGRLLGVLTVGHVGSGGRFIEEDRTLLSLFADEAAIAVEHARLYRDLEGRLARAQTLTRLNQLVSSSLDVDRVLAEIASAAATLTGAPVASFWLVDATTRTLQLRARWSAEGEVRAPVDTLGFGEGLPGWIATHRQLLHVPDVLADARTRFQQWWRERGLSSFLGVPVMLEGALLAVLALCGREPFRVAPDDETILDGFVSQAAVAIRNARLHEETERRRREAEVMAELAQTINSSLDLDTVLQRVTEAAMELCRADIGRICLRDVASDTMVFRYRVGARATSYDRLRIERGKGFGGLVWATDRPWRTDDRMHDSAIGGDYLDLVRQEGIICSLGVPIRIGGDVEGLIYVDNRSPRPFTDRHEAILVQLAEHAAGAIRNAQLFAREQAARAAAERSEQALIESRTRLELVNGIATGISSGLTVAQVIERALTEMSAVFPSLRVSYSTIDARGTLRVMRSVPPPSMVPLDGAVLDVAEAPEYLEALRRRQPVVVGDIALDARLAPLTERMRAIGSRAVLDVPVPHGAALVGVLCFDAPQTRVWSEHERATLAGVGEYLALAIQDAHARHERAQAAEALRESEERYRAIAENSAVGIWHITADGYTVYVNAAMCEILEIDSPAELAGTTYHRFFGPESLERTRAQQQKRPPGVVSSVEVEIMGARRGRREVVVAGAPLFAADGALQSFIGTFTDITERKRAEARLRESEERFRATFEQAAVGIGDVGIDGRWLRVNQRLCEMLGYTREELLQRTVDDVSHPDDLVADLATARQMVAGEIAQYSREKRYVRKNGGLLWVNLTASLVRDPGGAPKYFIAVAEDITTRRRAEEALRESEEQLRQAQKMEAIGRLAGGVAHDFNNLLTIIRGRSELLRERVGPASPLRRDIELIEQTAERAAALTHQLLAFSRKQVLQTRLVDLNAVVDEMSVMLRRLIGEDVELVTTLAPGLGLVKADPGQLEQALMNLVVNARDAMPLGGRLTIRTANEWLDAAFARQHWGAPVGRCAMVAVSDTGAGMTPEIQAHIFEPFFTTKERGKGTGLGLATVYGIVEQHSGLIQVESAPARGSTFRIYLPVVDTEPPSPETAAPPARLPRGTETILLVEDEPEVRELVTEILRGHGYRLLAAVDSADALRILDERAETIDLLLTDVVMPGMSGRDLAERVRRSRPQVKVLYMSGYTDDAVGERGVLDPGMVLLQKPFTPRTLLRKLRDVLD